MKKLSILVNILIFGEVVFIISGIIVYQLLKRSFHLAAEPINQAEQTVNASEEGINFIIKCKNGEQFTKAELINKNINFKIIGSRIFYSDELKKLCYSGLKELNLDAEPNFIIIQ